ncbi:MAG: hypothetical protein L3V56_01315 [Candidatus Magnetoovum sp. WYHC-5]|nr:hypothetical protein [Candidatus Magnetoovum sp. WYHC-5]
MYNIISLCGIFVLMAIAWLFSRERQNMNLHVIVAGLLIQAAFSVFIFIFPAGTWVFMVINDTIVKVMNACTSGVEFVFGVLSIPPGQISDSGQKSLGFILAFQAFPLLIFFSALMSVLYYLKIMPIIIGFFSRIFTRLMKVSGAESLCVASNIFVGVESALSIKPYMRDMTHSEFCTILTGGMATISSSMLAVYVFALIDYFPQIAGHLVSASFLSAPAALIMSKIIYPESKSPKTLGITVIPYQQQEGNMFEAVINGATEGGKLIFGIVTLLIAVLGLVSLTDLFLDIIGKTINPSFNWSIKLFLGYIFYPLTLIIGVPFSDVNSIAQIIGERTVVTEMIAYQDLATLIKNGTITSQRTIVVTTYALCGFAHIASMAIFVGGYAALAPERTRDLSEVGFRALLASILACLETACFAGLFFFD